jgi:hypothetical protein
MTAEERLESLGYTYNSYYQVWEHKKYIYRIHIGFTDGTSVLSDNDSHTHLHLVAESIDMNELVDKIIGLIRKDRIEGLSKDL